MSGSEQHNRVGLVSAGVLAIIGGIVNSNLMEIDFAERQAALEKAQELSSRVSQYTKLAAMEQRVSDHPAQIIALQKQITDLQTQQFLPLGCDHSTFE